jgi:hypothetical protein
VRHLPPPDVSPAARELFADWCGENLSPIGTQRTFRRRDSFNLLTCNTLILWFGNALSAFALA